MLECCSLLRLLISGWRFERSGYSSGVIKIDIFSWSRDSYYSIWWNTLFSLYSLGSSILFSKSDEKYYSNWGFISYRKLKPLPKPNCSGFLFFAYKVCLDLFYLYTYYLKEIGLDFWALGFKTCVFEDRPDFVRILLLVWVKVMFPGGNEIDSSLVAEGDSKIWCCPLVT